MKVNSKQLKRIIKEEARKLVTEAYTLYDEDDGVWEEYESLDELKADLEDISSRMDTDDWVVEYPDGNRKRVYELEEAKSVSTKQLKRIIQGEIRQLRNEAVGSASGAGRYHRAKDKREEEEIDMAALKKAAGLEDPDDPPADPEDPDDPEGEMELGLETESADLYAVWGEIAGITEGAKSVWKGSEAEAREYADDKNAEMGGKDDPDQPGWHPEERKDGWYAVKLDLN